MLNVAREFIPNSRELRFQFLSLQSSCTLANILTPVQCANADEPHPPPYYIHISGFYSVLCDGIVDKLNLTVPVFSMEEGGIEL